ncbi:unnamed protein product [Spodoptera exigua]|uniref:Homeobox domain-containing protein n=1 Tax=Spodoptera exigua TaxID=7107 RepID=A0A922M615_SPOEX|nr:hypothetical protein HF086_016115 [Spodoptera exigua]CAH0673934.1 unnamed protein product [Spodoptera exigua]
MNQSNQPPGPHNGSNGFATSTNPTYSVYVLPQHGTAPASVVVNQVQEQQRKPPDYRTWLNTQPSQSVQWPNNRPAPKKPKRVRTGFTTQQLMVLEKEYSRIPYLARSNRIELAEMLQLSERTIKIWFQNRRMKEKKEKLESSVNFQEAMVPYPDQEHTYQSATTPIAQNIILEQRQHPVARSITLNPSLGLDGQLHSNMQYKQPAAANAQMQSSLNFVLQQHGHTQWTNGVTQHVRCDNSSTMGSNSSLEGIVQNLQNGGQHRSSTVQYRYSSAETVQMRYPQNIIPQNQYYTQWANGATQQVHSAGHNEPAYVQFSTQNNIQNLQHSEQHYSTVQYRCPATATAVQTQPSQNLVTEPIQHPENTQGNTQPDLCTLRPVKTVPLKVFEEFVQKVQLNQELNSDVQYRRPVEGNDQSSQDSELWQYASFNNRDPTPVIHLESSDESSRSSVEDILQDLIVSEKQHLEAKERINKEMQALNYLVSEQHSKCTNGSTQHINNNLENPYHLQTKNLLEASDLPSDLMDVTPMQIEDIDIYLYLL